MAIYDIPPNHPSTLTISIPIITSSISTSATPPRKRLSISNGHLYITCHKITHIIRIPLFKRKTTGMGGGKREEWIPGEKWVFEMFGPAGNWDRSAGGPSV